MYLYFESADGKRKAAIYSQCSLFVTFFSKTAEGGSGFQPLWNTNQALADKNDSFKLEIRRCLVKTNSVLFQMQVMGPVLVHGLFDNGCSLGSEPIDPR